MKKIATLLMASLLIANLGFSQYEKIDWGKLLKSNKKSYYPVIIGDDEKSIYVTAEVGKENVVETYSKGNFSLELSKIITPQKIDKKKTTLEKVVFVDHKYFVFISYFDKKTKLSNMFVYKMDPKTGDKIGKEVKLFAIAVEKKKRQGGFNVVTSKDKSKILINQYAYYKKQKVYKDIYRLLDTDLNVLTKKTETIKKSDIEYKSYYHKIDNDGTFYFLKEYKGDGNKFYIVSYDANKDYEKWEEEVTMDKMDAKSGNSIVSGVTYTLNANDEIVMCGYYSERVSQGTKKNGKAKKEKMEILGSFYLALDKNSKEVKIKKINRFDQDFINQFKTAKDVKKDKDAKVPNQFSSIELIPKADGGMIMIGELYFMYHYYDNDGNAHHYELFGDLMVLNLDKDGNLLWANRIPKKQVFWYHFKGAVVVASTGVSGMVVPNWRTVQYFSYQAALDGDNVIILFNDNPKNTITSNDLDKTKSLTKLKKSVITRYNINLKTGKKEESLFMAGKDYEVYFKPMVSYQKEQGSDIYTFGINGKKYKYGILK